MLTFSSSFAKEWERGEVDKYLRTITIVIRHKIPFPTRRLVVCDEVLQNSPHGLGFVAGHQAAPESYDVYGFRAVAFGERGHDDGVFKLA